MFDIIFDGFTAFNQIGFFIGGFLCLAIGSGLLGNALYWRLKAERVDGTIIGVRKKGAYFHTVYHYMLSNGDTHEATSDTGINSPAGMETGKSVRLIVFPEKPEEARNANSYWMGFFGAIFAAPGAFLLWMAFTQYPLTWMTGVMALLFLFYVAIKFKKGIIPKEKRAASPEEWKSQKKAARKAEMQSIPVRPVEEYLASAEGQTYQKHLVKSSKGAAPLCLVIGIAMLLGGGWLSKNLAHLEAAGLRASGEVIDLEYHRDSDSSAYYPIVAFKTIGGESVRFKDKVGGNPPPNRRGEEVKVLYLKDDPATSAQIDRGLWNWLVPFVLFVFGGLLVLGGIKSYASLQKSETL